MDGFTLESGLGAGEKPSRILIVDDHAPTVAALVRLLSMFGHTVVSADTAASAVQTARRTPIDVLICDIDLPDGSGLDVMRRLRDLPIVGIAVTGGGDECHPSACEEAGFDGYLLKPMLMEDLIHVLHELQHRSRLRSSVFARN